MTAKPLLLLAALTLCCCFASLDARPRWGCYCMRTISVPVLVRSIKKVEVIPISGYCRQTEIIVTRRNNSRFCIDPNVTWLNSLLDTLQKKNGTASSTTVPRTAPSNN